MSDRAVGRLPARAQAWWKKQPAKRVSIDMTGIIRRAATVAAGLVVAACGASADLDETGAATATTSRVTVDDSMIALRDPEVPDLPFDDNPDPDQCGIPVRWGLDDPAWVTGTWEGELIQSPVLLYGSHLRLEVTGSVPDGGEVRIILFQENPVLDYYLVRTADGSDEGWLPAPFLSFDRPK
jgi:hypothetical protein